MQKIPKEVKIGPRWFRDPFNELIAAVRAFRPVPGQGTTCVESKNGTAVNSIDPLASSGQITFTIALNGQAVTVNVLTDGQAPVVIS